MINNNIIFEKGRNGEDFFGSAFLGLAKQNIFHDISTLGRLTKEQVENLKRRAVDGLTHLENFFSSSAVEKY